MGFTIAGARLLLVAVILQLRPGHVSAIPLSEFYSYGIGDETLPISDDGSSPAIVLKVPFRFFGQERSTVYVRSACGMERSTRILMTIARMNS